MDYSKLTVKNFNKMKYIYTFLLTLLFIVSAKAQQDPQYSQYMYNMSAVNPAYVTDERGLISTGLLYRKQWTGIEGAPQTANVFGNIPLGDKIELSVNYVNDRIGEAIDVNSNYFNIDFAYITRLSEGLKLSYGIKAGINSFSLNASDSDVSSDPAFSDNTSTTELTFGAGLFLFSNNFYFGVSSPNVLPNDVNTNNVGVSQAKAHIYAVSGYVFNLIDEVKLKPSFVFKQVIDAPLTFDVSLNALFYNRFEIGASYRYDEAMVGLAGFNITPNLKIGYAYDFGINDLNAYNNGSHEFILLYKFDLLNLSNTYTSPRFY